MTIARETWIADGRCQTHERIRAGEARKGERKKRTSEGRELSAAAMCTHIHVRLMRYIHQSSHPQHKRLKTSQMSYLATRER
jgi:hypothetical protein